MSSRFFLTHQGVEPRTFSADLCMQGCCLNVCIIIAGAKKDIHKLVWIMWQVHHCF